MSWLCLLPCSDNFYRTSTSLGRGHTPALKGRDYLSHDSGQHPPCNSVNTQAPGVSSLTQTDTSIGPTPDVQQEETKAWILEAACGIEQPLEDCAEPWVVSRNWLRYIYSGLNKLLFKHNCWLILGSSLWLSRSKVTIVVSSFLSLLPY